jgi:hypothetical protein
VARSWGDKLGIWLVGMNIQLPGWLDPSAGFNVMAGLLQVTNKFDI